MVSVRNQNPLDTLRLIMIVEARQERFNLPWEALVGTTRTSSWEILGLLFV